MVQRRSVRQGGEEHSNRRRQLASTICKGLNHGRNLQEYASCLEPMIRKCVKEEVDCALDPYLRSSSYSQAEPPSVPSRSLQLLFSCNFPDTLFTGNRLMSPDRTPVQVVMYNSTTKQVITGGPLSSLKVTISVLDGDFDREDWTTEEFDGKIVKNREGRRPLIAGELIMTLKNGVGHLGDVSFTDNSSWIRSGRFRLGAKANINANANGDEISIREAVSNAFRVKDHRGESYQKLYPPSSGDEVWRLEKIAKDGRSHKKLNDSRIYTVGDFLSLYATDHIRLRDILSVPNKAWETIIKHARTCTSHHPVNSLTNYQMGMAEDPSQITYQNQTEWVSTSEPSIAGYPDNSPVYSFTNPNLGFHVGLQNQDDQHGMGLNDAVPAVSSPTEVEQANCPFQLGESSHSMLQAYPTFRNSFNFIDSPGEAGFCIGANYAGSQLSTDDVFMFLDPANHDGIGHKISSNSSGTVSPRNKTRWCKVLAVVKWQLVRRDVAARKWKRVYSYM